MARGSGSAGGGGYDLQACVIALVGIHILAEEPSHWFTTKDWQDVPIAVSSETEGPGDDLRVELRDTQTAFEIQAKRGLGKGPRFNDTIDKFAKGLEQEPTFHCILAVDTRASRPIQELPHDLDRLRDGREDHLHSITWAASSSLSNASDRTY